MHGVFGLQGINASDGDGRSAAENSAPGKSAADDTTDGRSAVDDSAWFSDMAQALLAPKPGTALHYITGVDERLCQRYAANHVKPPAYFLRKLLRSAYGEQILAFLMDGSDAVWWLQLQRNARIGSAVAEITKRK